MRIFQNKGFKKWANDEGLSDFDLLAAIDEMESGLTGDSLGGNIYKKRIGLQGRGKSGGVRTIIAYKIKDKAFFLHGFAKNERTNISDAEEKALKMAAKALFQYTDEEIETALKAGALIEIVKPKSEDKQINSALDTEDLSEIAEKKSNGK